MPGSSINSWDSWFIFNLLEINTCYYTDTARAWTDSDYWQLFHLHLQQKHILNVGFPMSIFVKGRLNISLQTYFYWSLQILGLRFSWGTSRARPAWSPPGRVLTPALSPFWGTHARSYAPPEEVVYSLNDSCSHFTNVFSLQLSLNSILNILL